MSETQATEAKVDRVVPEGRWKFDQDVTDAFDDMLRRSIPQHDLMRRTVFDLACRFNQLNKSVVDLGCSRGESVEPLLRRYGALNQWWLVDVSEPMLAACRERYKGFIDANVMQVRSMDLRREYPPTKACVTLAILTLQFTPIEHRQRIVREAFKATVPGGCMIVVEKVLGATAESDAVLTERYRAMKLENGYSQEDVDRKALSLEGVLVPVTARWNEELLAGAGFRHVECFWRWMCFAGWLAIKE